MEPREFRETLKEVGLRQNAFARELGLSKDTVWRWATGALPVTRYAEAYLELLRLVRQFDARHPLPD